MQRHRGARLSEDQDLHFLGQCSQLTPADGECEAVGERILIEESEVRRPRFDGRIQRDRSHLWNERRSAERLSRRTRAGAHFRAHRADEWAANRTRFGNDRHDRHFVRHRSPISDVALG